MSSRKPIYLLAGGRGGGDMGPILNQVFKDMGKASPTIAYVGAANGDNPEFYQRMAGMLKNSRRCSIIHATVVPDEADVAKAIGVIEAADAVFVSGGDVEAGMQVLAQKGVTSIFPRLYGQGMLFFGVSAGSIMLAKEWVRWADPNDDSTAELFPCLGLAPLICDTHGEGDGWEELRAAVGLSHDGAIGYGITSGACLKIDTAGRLQAIAGPIATYTRQNGVVERQADIVA